LHQLHFSTEAYPHARRGAAWRDELTTARLRCQNLSADHTLHGTIQSRTTNAGIELTLISSVPQALAVTAGGGRGVLLFILLEGEGEIAGAGSTDNRLHVGEIVCVPACACAELAITTVFRLLTVHVGPALLSARVTAPPPTDVLRLTGDSGQLFARVLQSIAESFEAVVSADGNALHPFEGAILEFLSATLISCQPQTMPGMSHSGTAVFARVCSRINARLPEPDLSLASIAADEHVSPRYLQKLFEKSGISFSSYLRTSRLKRCRYDLANPLYDKLSVSDICYRWGFNDPSHFSHAFRDEFGISPSAYRGQMALTPDKVVTQRICRGLPPHAWLSSIANVRSNHQANGGMPATGTIGDATRWSDPKNSHDGRHHWLRATEKTVHWGYLSHDLPPVLEVESGDKVTIETLTQHASDDWERMVKGDAGAESVFHWTAEHKNVNRRGAGPLDASIYGRGAGEGFGVHICTGPIAVHGAMPGDVLEVRILDIRPRPCANAHFTGKAFGSNAATWWGFHYRDQITEPREREVVTIFEIDCDRADGKARALYNFRWTPQRDPFGVLHPTIDYPGVPVDHSTIVKNFDVLRDIEIPIRPHFGVIAVAPAQDGLIDSIPPSSFAGNLDNWRVTRGASVFLKVAVPGALLSIGDPHASQGDSELCGTAIECSLTGDFQLILHKRNEIPSSAPFTDLTYPLVETADEWIIHGFSSPNHLTDLGQKAQSQIYLKSTLDEAMRDAFRKSRRFLMSVKDLSEDEAVTLISIAVDFGITQVVNGNWGVHAIIRKSLFVQS
jgi:acetamidase/formamidase/AraC-like DNA-binding protein